MKQTSRILIGLRVDLLIGLLISATKSLTLFRIVSTIEMAVTLWVRLLKMTVIPPVMSLLITGVASASDSPKRGQNDTIPKQINVEANWLEELKQPVPVAAR
jgi:proton glutamate symport protein